MTNEATRVSRGFRVAPDVTAGLSCRVFRTGTAEQAGSGTQGIILELCMAEEKDRILENVSSREENGRAEEAPWVPDLVVGVAQSFDCMHRPGISDNW
jgi:hypothetical protein